MLQLSRENKREGLLPDCRVGVRAKTIRVECIGSTHGNLLSEPWYESDDCVTVGQQGVRWLQVRAWHDRSYIAWIPLLAHGLTVKLSPAMPL